MRLWSLVLAAAAIVPLLSCGSEFGTVHGAKVVFEGRKRFSESELLDSIRTELKEYDRAPDPALLSDAAFGSSTSTSWPDTRARASSLGIARADRVHHRGGPLRRAREGPAPRQRRDRRAAAARRSFPATWGSVPFSDRLAGVIRDHLIGAYAALGYAEAVVSVPDKAPARRGKEMDLTFTITEGKRYVVSGFEGLPDIPELSKKLSSLVGKPFTPHSADEVEAACSTATGSTPTPSSMSRSGRGWIANGGRGAGSRPGPGFRGDVGVSGRPGNRRARAGWIERRADLDEGKDYQASDLRRAENA